jgi:lipopolysaccharide/colanic/teichoic acid biosynthesis glycosyltransferase
MYYQRYFKRPLDFLLSSMAIVVLSPVLIVIAWLVRVKIGSPVLFKQGAWSERKIFHCINSHYDGCERESGECCLMRLV